jgi:hypothetical protein
VDEERGTVIVEEDGLRHGFTMVPNVILRSPQLTHGAKVAYGILLSYAWQDDHTFPGQDRMATDMGVERKAVIRYLKELKDRGAIRVQRRGMGKTNVYTIVRLKDVPFLGRLDVPISTHREVPPSGHAVVPPIGLNEYSITNTQSTTDNSNSHHSGKNVDNDVDNPQTPYLDNVITDFSREFSDAAHAHSNRQQARNIYRVLDIAEDDFVERFVYPARAATRLATGVEKRMPYFFAVLRDLTHATIGE